MGNESIPTQISVSSYTYNGQKSFVPAYVAQDNNGNVIQDNTAIAVLR
jgi:hypothetical protein